MYVFWKLSSKPNISHLKMFLKKSILVKQFCQISSQDLTNTFVISNSPIVTCLGF
jgi:hypothetical protein